MYCTWPGLKPQAEPSRADLDQAGLGPVGGFIGPAARPQVWKAGAGLLKPQPGPLSSVVLGDGMTRTSCASCCYFSRPQPQPPSLSHPPRTTLVLTISPGPSHSLALISPSPTSDLRRHTTMTPTTAPPLLAVTHLRLQTMHNNNNNNDSAASPRHTTMMTVPPRLTLAHFRRHTTTTTTTTAPFRPRLALTHLGLQTTHNDDHDNDNTASPCPLLALIQLGLQMTHGNNDNNDSAALPCPHPPWTSHNTRQRQRRLASSSPTPSVPPHVMTTVALPRLTLTHLGHPCATKTTAPLSSPTSSSPRPHPLHPSTHMAMTVFAHTSSLLTSFQT